MTSTSYQPLFDFPRSGNNRYSGMASHNELLWLSDYSGHEGTVSIYLAKIQVPLKATLRSIARFIEAL